MHLAMTNAPTLTARAWAEMGLLASIWGAIFLFTAISLREVAPLTTVAIRVGVGAVGLWVILALRGQLRAFRPDLWAAFAVMGALNNIIPFSLITWGQQFITSGLASILNAATGVVGVVVAAVLLADERMTAKKLIGALVAFAGVIITIGPAALFDLNLGSLAQWAILGAALSYSLAGVWARKRLAGVPPLVSATGMVTASAIILWPIAVMIEGAPSLDYSPTVWASLAYQGVMATTCAYLLYYSVLARAGSGNLMMVTLLLPPIALILGALVLDEALQAGDVVGFVVIALGLVIVDGRLWQSLNRSRRAAD